jgi:acyl carrier protein
MDEVRTRLDACFASVFPDLPPAELRDASPETVKAWDSLANATLVAVVEEEFGLEIPPDDLEGLASYASLGDYLERRTAAG